MDCKNITGIGLDFFAGFPVVSLWRKGVPHCCGVMVGWTMENPSHPHKLQQKGNGRDVTVQFFFFFFLMEKLNGVSGQKHGDSFACTSRGEEENKRWFFVSWRRPALMPKWVTPGKGPIPLLICEDFCEPVIRLTPVPCVHHVACCSSPLTCTPNLHSFSD